MPELIGIGLVGRVFTNDPEDLSSIPGLVITKTLKMVHGTFLQVERLLNMDENQTPSPHHGVLGSHKWWWRYASIHFPTRPQTQYRALYQVLGKGSAAIDQEGSC